MIIPIITNGHIKKLKIFIIGTRNDFNLIQKYLSLYCKTCPNSCAITPSAEIEERPYTASLKATVLVFGLKWSVRFPLHDVIFTFDKPAPSKSFLASSLAESPLEDGKSLYLLKLFVTFVCAQILNISPGTKIIPNK